MQKIIFNKQKDFISIIAPASGCPNAQDKLNQAIELLNSYGFKTLVDDKIFTQDELPFFAAPKNERLRMFKEAMENEQVRIIWTFHGGYGCGEFIKDCFNIEKKGDKILIGYSDITVLHALLNQHYNSLTIHGSVLTSLLPPTNQDIKPIIDILEGKKGEIQLTPINKISNSIIEGKIIGGNLKVFATLIGTSIKFQKGNILLLEDVNEKGYAIHRDLMHLKNAGIFENIEAVIFGDFTKGDEYVEQSIESFCLKHIPDIETYKAIGIGHTQVNYPIIMNHEVTISGNILKFTSPFEIIKS
ncbi:MAG TPA: LD-carboxypeptidase [Rickettsia endosymbiont of Pyrocoelia pectoralis]|nr:LD-carboxypeptidase [Rickettsia endosymbiont of Pyrocoelia pectoralis]